MQNNHQIDLMKAVQSGSEKKKSVAWINTHSTPKDSNKAPGKRIQENRLKRAIIIVNGYMERRL